MGGQIGARRLLAVSWQRAALRSHAFRWDWMGHADAMRTISLAIALMSGQIKHAWGRCC
jgi:hypothetical protein